MANKTQGAEAPEACSKQFIKRIQARLDRWELDHLRGHAASLSDQLDAATARAESAEAQLDNTHRWVESLQDELRALADAQGKTLGLTQAGDIVVLQPEATTVPKPGQHWPEQGGTYIGISSAEGDVPAHHLVALDAPAPKSMTWAAAKKWVASLGDGARLPTQLEAVLAWTTSPAAFEKTGWYWTGTQLSRSSAFVQVFEYGSSHWSNKDNEHRVRAFRGLTLETFTPLPAEPVRADFLNDAQVVA